MRLLKAAHFAEDFIRNGVPVWWDESDDVFFETEKKVSRSKAAMDRAEQQESKGDSKPPLGRYYVPVPKTRGGAPFPSFEDWMKEQERKRGVK